MGHKRHQAESHQAQTVYFTDILVAICPDKDKGCALVLAETNTGMMQLHLNQISEQVEDGYHAIIMMDRASWHTTEALVIPQNISILPLPPYSPELNPMEQVWQQLRKIRLSNMCFKNYHQIVDAGGWLVFKTAAF